MRAAAIGAAYYTQAQAAERHGYYRDAVADYEQAILRGHNDPGTYYELGLAFKQTKQLGFAEWAVAKALSDSAFSATHPAAVKNLEAIEQAGGYDVGPPSGMKNATMTAGTVQTSPAQRLRSRKRDRRFPSFRILSRHTTWHRASSRR